MEEVKGGISIMSGTINNGIYCTLAEGTNAGEIRMPEVWGRESRPQITEESKSKQVHRDTAHMYNNKNHKKTELTTTWD